MIQWPCGAFQNSKLRPVIFTSLLLAVGTGRVAFGDRGVGNKIEGSTRVLLLAPYRYQRNRSNYWQQTCTSSREEGKFCCPSNTTIVQASFTGGSFSQTPKSTLDNEDDLHGWPRRPWYALSRTTSALPRKEGKGAGTNNRLRATRFAV
jgi:hypothetical protein